MGDCCVFPQADLQAMSRMHAQAWMQNHVPPIDINSNSEIGNTIMLEPARLRQAHPWADSERGMNGIPTVRPGRCEAKAHPDTWGICDAPAMIAPQRAR